MPKKVCMLLRDLSFLEPRIFECEAQSLIRHGYEVVIIAPRKKRFLFDIDGSPITDRFREKVFKHRGVKVVTFDKERESNKLLTDPLYQLGLKEKADVYHVYEFASLQCGKRIKKLLNARHRNLHVHLIYDSSSFITDQQLLRTVYKQKWEAMFIESLKEVDSIIAVSDSMKAWFLAIDPLLPVEVIYNSPPLATSFQIKGGEAPPLVVAHEGRLTKAALQPIYEITDSCQRAFDFQFKIIGGLGYGETASVPTHLERKINNLGWVPYSAQPSSMKDVDIGLVGLESSIHVFSMPSNLFNYLSNGIPVIVNNGSDLKKLVQTFQCGLVINSQNPTSVEYVKGIAHLYLNKEKLREMSLNARRAMENTFSWGHMEKRLIQVYKSFESNQTATVYLLS
ncbi:glycosyltransferase [Radiobacillus deserti]|uniref:Glycosyltransferase family 4 protein n=1 Tax=Radiobacillus deserti TaxID=2594883 RepID=A0A516KD67_9BACI|nr:glycosyltransferase [Radiobacillus deserti]QDP39297.1 glycosyltransferase family 4 protein [Radiobacillus deserti]